MTQGCDKHLVKLFLCSKTISKGDKMDHVKESHDATQYCQVWSALMSSAEDSAGWSGHVDF